MTAVQQPEDSIVVQGLEKSYGSFQALKGLNFRVRPGEIVGFLGPNGAGKTTTMKILSGYMGATDGEVRVAGRDVRRDSEDVRRVIGYLPENVPLYDEMIVYDYLNFIAEVQEVERKRRRDRILEVAEMTGIAQVLGRTIRELSKGYRQRVGLAQAIIHEPEVIILDEPTTGLDPNQIIEIRDVIKTIGREKTIIFSTHILQEVTAVCDRIIIINEGELMVDGSLEELEARVAETTPGLLVAFGGDDRDGVRKVLEALDGVEQVSDVSGRGAEITFRVEGSDDDSIRKTIIAAEADTPQGLKSLRAAEPTLEDIFRIFTEKTGEETPIEDDIETPDPPETSDNEEEVDAPVEESEPTEEVVHG